MADDIRFSIRAEDETKGAFSSVEKNTRNFDRSFTQMTGKILSAAPAFAVATAAITGVYKAAEAVTTQFTDGLKAIEDYRMSTIQMSSVMANFSKKLSEGDIAGAWQESSAYASKMVKDLEIIDARSAASGRNIIDMTRTMITYGVQIDTNSAKQRDALVSLANAIQTLTAGQQNQAMQFIQEIRAVMEGVRKPGSVLIGLLERAGLNAKEFTKELQSGKKTIADILPYLEGFNAASGDLENTWTTIGSTLDTTRKRVLRAGLEPAFEDLLQLAKNINDTFVDMDGNLTQAGHTLKDFLSSSWTLASNTAKSWDQWFGGPGTRWVIGNFVEAYNYILSIGNAPLAEGGALDSLTKFELFGKGDSLDRQLDVAEEQIKHWRLNSATPGGWIASMLLGEDPLTYYERKAKEIMATIQDSLWLRPDDLPGPPEPKVPTLGPDPKRTKRAKELTASQVERFGAEKWKEEQKALDSYLESLDSFYVLTDEQEQNRIDKIWEERERREELKAEEEQDRQDKLISLDEFLMTERELLNESYWAKMEMIDQWHDQGVMSDAAYYSRLYVLEDKYHKDSQKLVKKGADAEKSIRFDVFKNAVGLIHAIAPESKIAALAGIAIQKGIALSTNQANMFVASMLAYSSQLVPGDPTSLARAEAAKNYTLTLGYINAGLIAATGFMEAGQVFSSGGSGSGYGGSTAVSGVSYAPERDTVDLGTTEEAHVSQVWNIHIENAYGDKDVLARDIIEAIDKARGDGF